MEKSQKKHVELHLVRHGQTMDNLSERLSGHQPVLLTEIGIEQAKLTGRRLKDAEFHHAYVSDLDRTKQTFEHIAGESDCLRQLKEASRVYYSNKLRERCGGVLEGGPLGAWRENAEREGKGIRQYKCANAESWEDVNKRAEAFLHEIVRNHLSNKNENPTEEQKIKVMAVTHGGYIMEFHNVANLVGKGRQPVYHNVAKNCSIHVFKIEYEGDGDDHIDNRDIRIQCVVENDNSHIC